MLKAGNFSKARPLIIGSSSSEGTLFVPQANTTSDIETFLRLQFPDLTTGDIATANGLYCSVPQTFPNVTATVSPLYNRLSAMYGDLAFSCPALEFAARLSEAGVAVHYARTNILDPVEVAAGYLVPHTWELQAVWGPEYAASYVALPGADSYNAGGINRAAVAEVQRYWTSFAGTLGDPNALREAGSPVWQRYGDGKRLVLRTNATAMEQVPRVEVDRCAFWANVSPRTHI
jgi:carboxylesterase type B